MIFLKTKQKYVETLSKLNDIGIALSSEHNVDSLLEKILEKAKLVSNADKGILYTINNDRLKYSIIRSDSMRISIGGKNGEKINLASVRLYHKNGSPNHKRLAAYVALHKESINIKNISDLKDNKFSGTKFFNTLDGYQAKSVLAVPLKNQKNEVLGVLKLLNAKDKNGKIIAFSPEAQHLIESLASQAAVAIENQVLRIELENLLEGIIKMLALAIDAKSSHTSRHCEAIPVIVEMLAKAANKQNDGYFSNFNLDDDGMYELRVAAWLHDCGKLTTPLSILDKATKLEMVYDRIENIQLKFEVLQRELEIAYLRRDISKRQYEKSFEQLMSDLRFVRGLNKGTEYVDDEKLLRLKQLSKIEWMQNLTNGESRKKKLIDEDERYNLSIRRGTINSKERQTINSHIDVTIDMLNSLPFPRNLKRVPEYAGGHHEKMDGTGFPKKLKRDEMSIPARMMAIADIFEALTSHDRPYKKPKKLSEALMIMARMKRDNHIDPDIFDLFIKEKIYAKYAKKFLLAEQIDDIDLDKIMAHSNNV